MGALGGQPPRATRPPLWPGPALAVLSFFFSSLLRFNSRFQTLQACTPTPWLGQNPPPLWPSSPFVSIGAAPAGNTPPQASGRAGWPPCSPQSPCRRRPLHPTAPCPRLAIRPRPAFGLHADGLGDSRQSPCPGSPLLGRRQRRGCQYGIGVPSGPSRMASVLSPVALSCSPVFS